MPYTIEEARAAVAKGAALLDEKKPGWREEMDWEEFDITQPCDCILGQCFGGQWGDFSKGLRFLFPQPADTSTIFAREQQFDFSVEHGFDTPHPDFSYQTRDGYYEILQRAWEEQAT